LEAFSKFKRHSVIVYVNTKNKLSRQFLSPIITGCLNSAITGKIIPKAVIASFDQGTVYAKMSYKQLKSSKEYSSTAKVVKLALKGEEPPVDKKVIPNWQVNNDNGFYIGTFVELKNDTKLIIKKPEGNNMAAEGRMSGRYNVQGASQDLQGVEKLALARSGNARQAQKLIHRMLDKTQHLLRDQATWKAVKVIAAELQENESISGRAAKHHLAMAQNDTSF